MEAQQKAARRAEDREDDEKSEGWSFDLNFITLRTSFMKLVGESLKFSDQITVIRPGFIPNLGLR